MSIKLIIVDDHPVVLKGLQQILSEYGQITLLDTCRSGEQLLKSIERQPPQVILMDIQMPEKNGFELTKIITKLYPQIAILVLTNIDLTFQARNILQQGAAGFLLKSAHPEILIEAIETVCSGKQYIDQEIKEKLLMEDIKNNNPGSDLSRREKEILTLIAKEYTSIQIAQELYISQRTVENHRLNILFKLGVKNTAGLVKKAIQLGLIH